MASQDSNPREATLISALSALPHSHLCHLTTIIAATFHHHHRRLISLVTSPILFSLTLGRLQTSSLHQKYLLISRHLLSNLTLLHHFIPRTTASATTPPPISATRMKLRDLDAVLLLLLLCELHQYRPELLDSTRPEKWRGVLGEYLGESMLGLSASRSFCNTTSYNGHEVLMQYVECIGRCWNFVKVMGSDDGGGGGGKLGPEAAASVAAVVALPSVAVAGGECVICKEEMEKWREACELPCGHLFHWVCVLEWLKKKDTCPCCRHRLPSNDVRREIDRLFEDLVSVGGGEVAYRECS